MFIYAENEFNFNFTVLDPPANVLARRQLLVLTDSAHVMTTTTLVYLIWYRNDCLAAATVS